MATTTAQAAAMLGVPVSEVTAVADVAQGPQITTRDGQTYINVTVGVDGEGKSGLMYFAAPVSGYAGHFPVYEAVPPKAQRKRSYFR